MIVSYLGDGYFRLQNGERIIDIDPTTGRAKSDITIRTSFNGAIEELGETEIAFPGEYEIKEIEVYGFPSPDSTEESINSIYRIQWEDVSFVVLDSIMHIPSADILNELIEPDILIIPAGKKGGLPTAEAVKLVRELEPSIVIPSYDTAPKDFLKEMGQTGDNQDKFVFKKKELTPKVMHVVVLEAKNG